MSRRNLNCRAVLRWRDRGTGCSEALANPVAVGVEDERGEAAGVDLRVGAEGNHHLLVAPLHHVESDLDDLVWGEVRVQPFDEFGLDRTGLGDERIAVVDRRLLGRREVLAVADGVLYALFIKSCIRGNCQANRESRVAVVMGGTSQTYQFGGDRVDCVVAHRGSTEAAERFADVLTWSSISGESG